MTKKGYVMKTQTNTALEKLLKEKEGNSPATIISFIASAVLALLFLALASYIDTGVRKDVLTRQSLEVRFVGRS